MRVLEVWLGHSSFLFGSAPGHSLRVVPIARRGRAPSAALPALPGSGLPGERADKFPRRESERTGLRKLAAGGRGSRVRSHRLEAEPISPAPGFWRGPGPEHAPPRTPTVLSAPPGDAPGPGSPKQAPSSPSVPEDRTDSRAPGCLLPQPPGPPGPHAQHLRLAPSRSPGPRASRAPWAQRLLGAPCAPVSRVRTRTQHPRAAGPCRDSPALGL